MIPGAARRVDRQNCDGPRCRPRFLTAFLCRPAGSGHCDPVRVSCLASSGADSHVYRTSVSALDEPGMSILSQNLHQSILRALRIAGEHWYDRATPEHLLLALTDDPDAAPVMRACNVDLEQLRRIVSMSLRPSSESSKVPSSTVDPRPNASFQSINQRAVRHIQSVEQNVVTGAHVLVATFAEPVAQFLSEQGMTRYDAVSYVCHGIVKQLGPAAETGAISEAGAESENKANGPTYEVVLQNDEYTPMELVVWVLQEVFCVTHENAVDIILSVHKSGTGSLHYAASAAISRSRRVVRVLFASCRAPRSRGSTRCAGSRFTQRGKGCAQPGYEGHCLP